VDLAPTLGHELGVHPTQDVDGQVLELPLNIIHSTPSKTR
jgi:hypothetical protein